MRRTVVESSTNSECVLSGTCARHKAARGDWKWSGAGALLIAKFTACFGLKASNYPLREQIKFVFICSKPILDLAIFSTNNPVSFIYFCCLGWWGLGRSVTENEVCVCLLRPLHCRPFKPPLCLSLIRHRQWSKTLSAMEEARRATRWEGRRASLTSPLPRWATGPCLFRPPRTPHSRRQGVSPASHFIWVEAYYGFTEDDASITQSLL